MGNALSGRSVTGSRESDELVEQLDSLRIELKENLREENQAAVLRRHAEVLENGCQNRTRRTVAALTLLEKKLGYTGLTEVIDHETVRIDGVTIKIPSDHPIPSGEPLNDPAAIGRFVGAITEDARVRAAAAKKAR